MARRLPYAKRRANAAGKLIDPALHQENFMSSVRREMRRRDLGASLGRLVASGDITITIKRSPFFYRFEGGWTELSWAISDIPRTWPMIDELCAALNELEAAIRHGDKVRMLKRRIETLAMLIERESTRHRHVRTEKEFTDVFA